MTTDVSADVEAMTDEAMRALAAPSWCSLVTLRQGLVWSAALEPAGRVVRRLRGRKMRTWAALMDEVGAALQFGDYFGENLSALDECLSDLDWLPTDQGYVLVVVDPQEVLVEEAASPGGPDQELENLIDVLATAAATYAEPVELGEAWDRPAVGFDVILAPAAEHQDRVVHLWRQAGAPL